MKKLKEKILNKFFSDITSEIWEDGYTFGRTKGQAELERKIVASLENVKGAQFKYPAKTKPQAAAELMLMTAIDITNDRAREVSTVK